MAKEIGMWIWIVVAVAIVAFVGFGGIGSFAITGSETMTRTSSISQVSPSGTFQVTYTAVGTSGTWGASIVDSVTGGCKFPDGSTGLQTVMLSSDGNTKTVTVTAPSTSGTCTFTGDYKYGTESVKNFAGLSVQVKTESTTQCTSGQTKCEGTVYYTCSNSNWVSNGQVDGKCGYSQIIGGCGTVTPGLEDECCRGLGYDYWSTTENMCKNYDGDNGFCLEFSHKLLNPITKSDDCTANTILFILTIVVILLLVLARRK